MKRFVILSAFVLLSQLSATIATMSEQEIKACGIEKLTAEEKEALEAWISKQTPKVKAPVLEKNKVVHGEFIVKENVNLGRFITLDNGITYDIPSRSRKKTMAWKINDKIRLIEPVRPTNFKLENLEQKQTIGAKIAVKKTPKSEVKSP